MDTQLGSIITADIGTTVTHAALIEPVEGTYRLVARAEAPTTLAGYDQDITVGLGRAVEELGDVVQRRLWSEGTPILPETASGEGADALFATCSAAPPLTAVIVGLTDDLSVQSARRACAASIVRMERSVSLGARFHHWEEETLAELYRRPPEVLILVGGADAAATAPLESAAGVLTTLYERMPREQRPVVVFAGNLEARRSLAALISPVMEFRVVDNVRPNVHVESLGELERELGLLYEQIGLPKVPGFRKLSQWARVPVRSSMEALGATLRFVARRGEGGQGALAVDVGGMTTHVAAARDRGYQWATCADTGTSYGLEGVLARAGVEGLARWLPRRLGGEEIASRLRNAMVRPYSVAESRDDLLLLHAALRESLSSAMAVLRERHWGRLDGELTTPPFDLIAARGGVIAHTPHLSLVTLSLLDSIQPVGLTRLVVDWAAVWPVLGVLAQVEPLAAVQVLERDAFRDLGTVIAPRGQGTPGAPALQVTMRRSSGAPTEREVSAGSIVRLPLALGEEAIVEVRPTRDYDIGLGRWGVGGRASVRGGGLGIIIDARGRPLRLPTDERELRRSMITWVRSLEGDADASG
ncbi:MAG TPA: glutamate mutase L [Armatimonadota bacterium]|nr:glutamate mutase L [Armatimonadota bacterium]